MIKYAHNLFNAAKISYFNELWRISNYLGIDFEKVRETVVRTAESCWNRSMELMAGCLMAGLACLKILLQ
jgi:UDPglucose 6-dehydrogenase